MKQSEFYENQKLSNRPHSHVETLINDGYGLKLFLKL